MYTHNDLNQEIRAQFARMESESGAVPKSWLIRSVMAAHGDVHGEDAEFASYCAEGFVTKEVESYFREIKASETDLTEQLVIEGYEYVKARYLVKRSGEIVAVPVLAMTYQERAAKVAELRGHAAGTYAHADELERLNEALRAQEAE